VSSDTALEGEPAISAEDTRRYLAVDKAGQRRSGGVPAPPTRYGNAGISGSHPFASIAVGHRHADHARHPRAEISAGYNA